MDKSGSEAKKETEGNDPILHVLVVGFHHKKGCQVEYSYPPLIEGNSVDSQEIPEKWKHIPSLALPDGAHNFSKDTVYFVLPGLKHNKETVYGVSCYRQIDSKDLINKTADITRSTVQKSVCVLSRLPLFGLIKAKLELITHAYFDERDFSQVSLLEQTYKHLNVSLSQSLLQGSQVFLDLSLRDLVGLFKHKVIILFKLVLLERRVLYFGSPVESLCQVILSVLSLFPDMIENGLKQACNQCNIRTISPTLGVASVSIDQNEADNFLEVRYHESTTTTPESPLAEVLNHIHNSSLNMSNSSPSDIDLDNASSRENMTEAPESPNISRDFDQTLNTQNEKTKYVDTKMINRSNSNESDKLNVHNPVISPAQSSPNEVSHKSENKSIIPISSEKINETEALISPLANIDSLTQIETVQEKVEFLSGEKANESTESNKVLSLDSTKVLPKDSVTIDELDSPESLNLIDKEDCFSWEQDRIQLAIHHDSSSEEAKSNKNAHHSIDSLAGGESDLESQSSGTTVESLQGDDAAKGLNISVSKDKTTKSKALKHKLTSAFNRGKEKQKQTASPSFKNKENSGDIIMPQDSSGFPLTVFAKGSVCHPYLSLQYHDILTDVNIRGFMIGATNVLFKQRKQLVDVIVEISDGKVEVRDKELDRHLALTTADLRFADFLVKAVVDEKNPAYFDGTEWEGSDEWLRAQFKHYLNSLLATVVSDDQKLLEDFGLPFLNAWKTTQNFHYWQDTKHTGIEEHAIGHPFQGNLSMTDIRVRFNHTLQNTERGRKINAAVTQTGKYVVQTGKAVGGAISSAKSAVAGWFSGWRTNEEKGNNSEVKN